MKLQKIGNFKTLFTGKSIRDLPARLGGRIRSKFQGIDIPALLENKNTYFTAGSVFIGLLILLSVIPVFTEKVLSDRRDVTSQGMVEARDISINSKIPGRIVKVYVEEGAEAKAGDVLVEISSEELKAKREQAIAQVSAAKAAYDAAKGQTEAARATLDKAEKGARDQEIAQAKSAYDLAVKSLNRVDALYRNKQEQTLSMIEAAKAAYEGAQGQTSAAKALEEKAQNGARAQELAQAQAQYDLAVKTYERVKKLQEKGAVSAQKLDEVKTQLDVVTQMLNMAKEGARAEDKTAAQATVAQALANEEARRAQFDQANSALDEVEYTFGLKRDEAEAQVEIRKAALDMATEGARVEDKSGAQALVVQALAMEEAAKSRLDQAQGGLDEIDVYLKDTKILAPTEGTVTSLIAHEGELVSQGMSIATLSSLDHLWVEVKVKETTLNRISAGQTVNFRVPGFSKDKFSGKITVINKKPDFAVKRATNDNGDFDIVTYGVRIEPEHTDPVLRPGMTAFVTFPRK